jgi:cytosine/adenosine deaminase-related metal-dependent hydrolase
LKLLSAPWVVPVDREPLREGAILVTASGAIKAVGDRAELRRDFAGVTEERGQGALLPALVNAHTHLELAALRGQVPGGAGLVAWATSVPMHLHAQSATARHEASMQAARIMVATGTGAVGDVGNGLGAIPAIAAAGLRGIFFHELLGSRDRRTGDALADAEKERAAYARPWPDRLDYVPAAHAPYSASLDLLRRVFAATAQGPHPTSIHIAEDEDEVAFLKDQSGKWPPVLAALGVEIPAGLQAMSPITPVGYLAALGAFARRRPPLLVHMVHANADDRKLAREHGATAVLCPRSNLHIGGRLPRVPELLADGVAIALGTDSLASTPDPSLWGDIATFRTHYPGIPAEVWLHAATAGGARALGLADQLGSLTPGKRPGVIDVCLDDLEHPLESLAANAQPTIRWITHP